MSFDDDMLITAVSRASSQQKASMRTGKVVSVDTTAGTIVVEVSGVQLRDIPYDAGLSPIPGKVVWLIDQGPWIAAVAAPASTGQGGGSGGGGGGSGVTDHGALTGLNDDDHPQYLTVARGDIRYPLTTDLAAVADTVPAAITAHEAAADPHPAYLKPAEIVAGANITVTEDAGVVTIAGQAGGGGSALVVRQTVVGKTTTMVRNSTDQWAATGLTATITLSSPSSKVLVLVTQSGVERAAGSAQSGVWLRLMRAATPLTLFGYPLTYEGASRRFITSAAAHYMDAPGSVGPHTYSTEFKNNINAASVAVQVDSGGGESIITLLEVIEGSGGSGGGATVLSDLADVDTAAPADGQALVWNGAGQLWVPGDVAAVAALDDLTDVVAPASTPAGKMLGTTAQGVWGPVDPPAGGGGGGNVHVGPTPPLATFGQVWIKLTEVAP